MKSVISNSEARCESFATPTSRPLIERIATDSKPPIESTTLLFFQDDGSENSLSYTPVGFSCGTVGGS